MRKRLAAGTGLRHTSGEEGTAIFLVIGSCISLQLGAALAIELFAYAGTWGTAAIRLGLAGLVLAMISRPRVLNWTIQQWRAVALLGLSMGLMNGFFYSGIATIPLGTAVTIEFLGPLLLAAVLTRSLRDALCVGLAVLGIVLLGVDSLTNEPLNRQGVLFILAAGTCWAGYILAGKAAAGKVPGQSGLAVALLIGSVVLLPMGGSGVLTLTQHPELFGYAAGTAALGSLIPYSLEFMALRRITPTTFSILIALEPVFAAGFGMVLLAETIGPVKALAIAVVVAASIIQTARPAHRSTQRSSDNHITEPVDPEVEPHRHAQHRHQP